MVGGGPWRGHWGIGEGGRRNTHRGTVRLHELRETELGACRYRSIDRQLSLGEVVLKVI